jgi:hypothetical protein
MKLNDLCDVFRTAGFPGVQELAHPDHDLVFEARRRVEVAVTDDEFLADCITYELMLIEAKTLRQGLVPFFTMSDLGIRFAFGYWAPGATAGPHEHTAWTISAVCRNYLEVTTYNRTESYEQRRLIPKNHFQAPAGKVGYIAEPCIHEPRNTSRDWSLSLHITSPRDGESPGDYEPSALPGLRLRQRRVGSGRRTLPYDYVVNARRTNHYMHLLARTVASMSVPQVPELFDRLVALGSPTTQEFAQRARPACGPREPLESDGILVRSHRDLVLTSRRVGDMVAVVAETPNGPVDDLFVDELAADALRFATRKTTFSVAELPGDLSDEERTAIADALVEAGLFTRERRTQHA